MGKERNMLYGTPSPRAKKPVNPDALRAQIKYRTCLLAPPCSLPSGGQLCVADPFAAKRAAKRDVEARKREREETKSRILLGLDYISNSRAAEQLQNSGNNSVDEQLSTICRDLQSFLDPSGSLMIGHVRVPKTEGHVAGGDGAVASGSIQSPRRKPNEWIPLCAHLESPSANWSHKSQQSQSSDGLARALEVMRTKSDDPAALAQSCEVFWHLADKEDTCELILDAGGPEALVRCMRLHPSSLRVQESGCDAIRRLASKGGPVAQKSIAAAGSIEAIVVAMTEHATKKGMQEAGCAALERIIDCVPENRIPFVEAKAIDVVISAMLRHPSTMKVQWAAVDALAALIAEEHQDDAEVLPAVIDASAIEALVAAWQRHPTDLQLVVAINNTLRRLHSFSKEAALRIQGTLRKNRMRVDQFAYGLTEKLLFCVDPVSTQSSASELHLTE